MFKYFLEDQRLVMAQVMVFYKIIDGEDERWGIAGYSSSYDS